jgi:CheY-like chemotaxis protein
MVGRALARSLSEHEVTAITSPREALARIAAGERWDVILCDLMMPEMGAPELRDRLAGLDAALVSRTIYMTGGALTGTAAEFLRTVTNPRLEKPFDVSEIRGAMDAVIARRQLEVPA